jgi:hypothetical protein
VRRLKRFNILARDVDMTDSSREIVKYILMTKLTTGSKRMNIEVREDDILKEIFNSLKEFFEEELNESYEHRAQLKQN